MKLNNLLHLKNTYRVFFFLYINIVGVKYWRNFYNCQLVIGKFVIRYTSRINRINVEINEIFIFTRV